MVQNKGKTAETERRYRQVLAELAALDEADPKYRDPANWRRALALVAEAKALVARGRLRALPGGKP